MDATPHHICEGCGVQVEPGEPGVVEAAEILPVHSFGGKEWIEGRHVLFHEWHYPRYRLVRPAA